MKKEEKLIKEMMMTQQSQEAKQTDREPEEKLEIKALFQTKKIPANVLCGESTDGRQLQDHLHIKQEEEELWESLEETDIMAVTVKSEDEEEEAQCSLLQWRQSQENIKGEPGTCSSAKLMKVEPNGDISEGPEAANTFKQQDTDGEETDCSDTEYSEDWREPLSQSEVQSEHMDLSCESFQTSENNINDKEKQFGCDVCGKRFGRNGSLKRHMIVHSGGKPFGCDVCGKRFNDRAHLAIHIKIHTGEKPFSCDVCEKKFGRNECLKRHMIIHSGEKSFGCLVCSKGFRRKSDLKTHIRIHTGEKPFGCDICGKQFSRKIHLTHHMLIHSGEKPYGCDVCQKRFMTKREVVKHTRIHTGEKPFSCDVCSKRFCHKFNLTVHMRIHTGEKPFGCDVCGQTFIRKQRLSSHMRIHTEVKS